jgi:hypothetical protein
MPTRCTRMSPSREQPPNDSLRRHLVTQGTWACSVMGSCELVVRNDSAASLVVALRLLRVFRIIWIFKNFNVLSINTVLGRLQVRVGCRVEATNSPACAFGTAQPSASSAPSPQMNHAMIAIAVVSRQDELYAARWAMSLLELLIVLAFLGHLSGCFFYFFSSPRWWTRGARAHVQAHATCTHTRAPHTHAHACTRLRQKDTCTHSARRGCRGNRPCARLTYARTHPPGSHHHTPSFPPPHHSANPPLPALHPRPASSHLPSLPTARGAAADWCGRDEHVGAGQDGRLRHGAHAHAPLRDARRLLAATAQRHGERAERARQQK